MGLIQVGDLQERVMQIKVLASADNPDTLSNLLAFLREELIEYIIQHHTYALPKSRTFSLKENFEVYPQYVLNKKFERISP